ncbi:MAG TPA: hypothetical protein VJL10_00425 [Anaerolineales bacterium]|nr:hypothetical protein [Anaerolineales bacterium]
MDLIKKIFEIIFAVLFIFTAVLALIFFNFDRRAFTAETYQRAFAREDFYNRLPSVMADAMTSLIADQSQFPVVLSGMSKEAWEAFFHTLLPPETLKVMGDDVLNSTFAYLNMQTDSAQLNLAPLKASMASDTGAQAVFAFLSTQPDCTFIQIAQITINLLSGGQIELCNPPAELIPALTPILQGQLQIAATVIPDQVTIISAPPQNDPRQRLQTARLVMRLSPILLFAFLLGLTILAVRSLKSWLSWWGVSFITTGLIAFVIGLLGAPIFGKIFQRVLVSLMPLYLPTLLLGYASDLASAMVQTLLSPVLRQGLAFALIGFGMAVISYFVKKQK